MSDKPISPQKRAALQRKIDAVNPERYRLIKKEVRKGLTKQEEERLAYLQQYTLDIVRQITPRPYTREEMARGDE